MDTKDTLSKRFGISCSLGHYNVEMTVAISPDMNVSTYRNPDISTSALALESAVDAFTQILNKIIDERCSS